MAKIMQNPKFTSETTLKMLQIHDAMAFSKVFGQIALSAGYTSYTNCREGIEGGGTMKLERKVKVTPHKREIHTHPTKKGLPSSTPALR